MASSENLSLRCQNCIACDAGAADYTFSKNREECCNCKSADIADYTNVQEPDLANPISSDSCCNEIQLSDQNNQLFGKSKYFNLYNLQCQ